MWQNDDRKEEQQLGVTSESAYRPEVVGHKNCVAPRDRARWRRHSDVVGVWNTMVANQNGPSDLLLQLAGSQTLLFTNRVRAPLWFCWGHKGSSLFLCSGKMAVESLRVEWLEYSRPYCAPEALALFIPSQGALWSGAKALLVWRTPRDSTGEDALVEGLGMQRPRLVLCDRGFPSGWAVEGMVWPVPCESVEMRLRLTFWNGIAFKLRFWVSPILSWTVM